MTVRRALAAVRRLLVGTRRLVVCGVLILTSAALTGVVLAGDASAAPTPRPADVRATLAGLKLMNYYPADAAWTLMWSDWNAAGLAGDFKAIAQMHANAVRLFVSPAVFGWPLPAPTMLARLRATIALAAAAHLQVELTIFDLWPDYNDFAGSDAWAKAVLTPYANDHEIVFVETRNEVDVDNSAEMAWLREQIPFDKRILQTVPVTASVAGSVTTLGQAKAALAAAGIDFLDWHYLSDGTATQIYDRLAQAKAIAGSTPLFIGEAGIPTLSNTTTTSEQADQDQLAFYTAIDWATRSLGLPDAAPWTFTDFTPGAIPPTVMSAGRAAEYHFGLRTTSGRVKPSGLLTAAFFASGRPPSVINGEFTGSTGSSVAGWAEYHAAEGTFTSVAGVSKLGGNSVEIRASTGDRYGLPSYDTVLPLAPTPAAHFYTASAWVRGQRETGTSIVLLAWFAASGTWLGNTASPPLAPGTTGWTQLTAAGPSPPGAAKVMVYLQAADNTGVTLFSDVAWTVT